MLVHPALVKVTSGSLFEKQVATNNSLAFAGVRLALATAVPVPEAAEEEVSRGLELFPLNSAAPATVEVLVPGKVQLIVVPVPDATT
jgi:hypothetical protein